MYTADIGGGTLALGRSSSNDIALNQPGVSAHHALIVRTDSGYELRDLSSTNGSFVNDQPVLGAVPVTIGDVLRLGPSLTIRCIEGSSFDDWSLHLERSGTPLGWPVDRTLFALPDAPGSLLRVGEQEVWLIVDGEERSRIDPGVPFTVAEREYVLRERPITARTVRPAEDWLPYRLEVDLDDERASLSDGTATTHIRTPNRVALLHVLATARLKEPSGWLDDSSVCVGVWGRGHRNNLPNNLNVLIHRLRAEVQKAGMDRWFIERRTGQTRVRVAKLYVR